MKLFLQFSSMQFCKVSKCYLLLHILNGLRVYIYSIEYKYNLHFISGLREIQVNSADEAFKVCIL